MFDHKKRRFSERIATRKLRIVVSNDQYYRIGEFIEDGMSVEVITPDGGTTPDINGRLYTLKDEVEIDITMQSGQDLTDFWDNMGKKK